LWSKSNEKSRESFEAARDYAFLLLKFRQRSEKELLDRLRKKRFDPGVNAKVLGFLKERKFIGDSEFARAWIESRLKKPFGLFRIKRELVLKGVDEKIIEEQVSKFRGEYSESEIVLKLAVSKLSKLRNIPAESARRRVYAFLARRGFSPETIKEALEQISA